MSRDNYSYNKFQKEAARKKKKEEKRLSKLNKKNSQINPGTEQLPADQVTAV